MNNELPTVSVVVLNYNGLKHLESCFSSLLALDYPPDLIELILVDNASRDDSIPFTRKTFPSVRIVETGSNLGFAAGNNFGAERATGEYVAFLNNDTRVDPRWLTELVSAVLAGRGTGLVCTASLVLNWAGEKIDFKTSGVNFHGFGFQPSYGKPYKPAEIAPRDILFACGGSMLIDRAIFLEIGGFDPDYFAFFEDVDLGWRLWLLGYRVTLTPSAITYHRHHGTAGSMSAHRTYLLYERNALYTIYKNYEDAHVHKILSAALLLLGGRAIRFIEAGGTSLADFDFSNPESDPSPDISIHRNAVAALLAANEFSDNLARTRVKRDWIQSRRKRSDRELFALFGQPGRVNWINHATDAPYSAAHYALLTDFGIAALWDDLPKEVLLISPDVLPVGDIPATGSGIRAWALGKGLEAQGHHVHYTMPSPAIKGREGSVPPQYVEGAWSPDNLQHIVDDLVPDVIVSCGWPNLTWLPRPNLPIAIDLTGPHLLERMYQGHRDARTNSLEKVLDLSHGDFFTTIGERQRYYFQAWLAQAGLTIEELESALATIPYSLDPHQPTHVWPINWENTPVRFVYGGIFLPWQNPAPALVTVSSTLDEQNAGQLEIIGGKHPFYPIPTGIYGPLLDRLATSTHTTMTGLLSHDRLVDKYTHAHVAVDMIMPNAERRLAFPSRTIYYLWCGLPVIHPAFSEVSSYILAYEAGWVVPHDDPAALREVILSILANPDEARRRGENAQRLAADLFSWDKTITPLAAFVHRPYIRPDRAALPDLDDRPTHKATSHAATSANPEGYLVTDSWDRKLPARLATVHASRRRLSAQVTARSRGLLRAFAPTRISPRRYPLTELVAGHSQGQRFLSKQNGLSGIVVVPALFGRSNTSRLVLHIRTNPGASSDLHSLNLPAHNLKEGQALAFRFPPIPDSANRWFYFIADSPDGVPGDAVTLYATNQPEGIAAQRYEDGLPTEGALVMSLEYNGAPA
jgi:GT2 family glycosyltransferase